MSRDPIYHGETGLEWGPMTVEFWSVEGHPEMGKNITVKASKDSITVYVSRKGKSIRAFKNNKELK